MPYAAGTCHDCGGDPDGGSRCKDCREVSRAVSAERRANLIARGLCLVCSTPVAKTKLEDAGRRRVRKPARYCTKHLAYYASRARAAR